MQAAHKCTAGSFNPDFSPRGLLLPLVRWDAAFVLGFATAFMILGASTTALGRALISYRHELNQVGGGVVSGFVFLATAFLRPVW